jgi:hypothetical protein
VRARRFESLFDDARLTILGLCVVQAIAAEAALAALALRKRTQLADDGEALVAEHGTAHAKATLAQRRQTVLVLALKEMLGSALDAANARSDAIRTAIAGTVD